MYRLLRRSNIARFKAGYKQTAFDHFASTPHQNTTTVRKPKSIKCYVVWRLHLRNIYDLPIRNHPQHERTVREEGKQFFTVFVFSGGNNEESRLYIEISEVDLGIIVSKISTL